MSILTQQQSYSLNHNALNEFSTIKSIDLKQQHDPILG
jgi:hypothetical protein